MLYQSGLYEGSPERWADAGETFEAMLIDDAGAYVFDVSNSSPSQLVVAEVAATGYARATLGTRSATWDGGAGRWRMTCASMTFGSPEAGTDVAGVAVYRKVTDDTDSVLWGFYEFTAPVATDDTTFTVTLGADGVATVGNTVP